MIFGHFFPETPENRKSFNLNALKSNSVFHFLKNVLEFSAVGVQLGRLARFSIQTAYFGRYFKAHFLLSMDEICRTHPFQTLKSNSVFHFFIKAKEHSGNPVKVGLMSQFQRF